LVSKTGIIITDIHAYSPVRTIPETLVFIVKSPCLSCTIRPVYLASPSILLWGVENILKNGRYPANKPPDFVLKFDITVGRTPQWPLVCERASQATLVIGLLRRPHRHPVPEKCGW
jgi:hypothetical protein